jgi:pimeloyl-ACP methyl ester carboxylesterase
VHILGHAFGNRIARCLAADHPAMVRGVILVAAGGLIGPSTPLGSSFRDAPSIKLTGPECVALRARWLSPASARTNSETVKLGYRKRCAEIAAKGDEGFIRA